MVAATGWCCDRGKRSKSSECTESKCVKTIIRLNLCDVCWRTLSYEKETSDSKIKENIYISSIPAHGGLIQVITYANNKGIIDSHDLYLLFNASNTSQIVRDDWWLLSNRQMAAHLLF